MCVYVNLEAKGSIPDENYSGHKLYHLYIKMLQVYLELNL